MIYHILYNPLSGNGDAEDAARILAAMYQKEVCCHDLTKLNPRSFLETLDEEDGVILCGGDGTLNRWINATEGCRMPKELLYAAFGSGNDFLRDLGQAEGEPFPIGDYLQNLPYVEVGGVTYRFLNNVGFGIDGYCCEVGDALKESYRDTNEKRKPISYTAIAIKGLLFHFKPTGATVNVDGTEYRYQKVWLAPTMKGRFYGGGMIPTPAQDRADPDGKLSLMVFHSVGKLRALMIFPSIFKGKHIKYKKSVAIHTGHSISVTFDRPTALQIDGETISGVTSYRASAKVLARSV